MRIRHLSIRNFRGVRELDWALPDKSLYCLIGRGDSTKSTILDAVRRAFHPQWSLAFDDADFFQCNPEHTINIQVTLGDIPDEFRDVGSYGNSLSGWDLENRTAHEDPGEGLEDALRVRLVVAEDLEPQWCVIKNDGDEGRPFKANDREKVAVSLIGAISDRHLTWARGSLLSHMTDSENISSSLASAGRAAKAAFEERRDEELLKFDIVARTAEATARALGVAVTSSYKAQLDSDAVNVRIGGLSLHDGEVPLRQLGLGSKRMLTTGLQKEHLRDQHITLIDEIELGLEPHRIARLLQHLQQDVTGQYFLTTHSPVVVRELTVDDLHIVHSNAGMTAVVSPGQSTLRDSIQGKIRSAAEAFLAPKVIVCEGATEVGFLRGLDFQWSRTGGDSFAYQGVALVDAKGANKVRDVARDFAGLSYSVAVLADSDRPDQFSQADIDFLVESGVAVVVWNDEVCLEERALLDLPWEGVLASFRMACVHHHPERIHDQVQTRYGSGLSRSHAEWADSLELRKALGAAASGGDWFKRQDLAAEWVAAIAPFLNDPSIAGCDLVTKLRGVRTWASSA